MNHCYAANALLKAETNYLCAINLYHNCRTPIADATIAAKERGVDVRMILDASGAVNSYSKHEQLCAVLLMIARLRVQVGHAAMVSTMIIMV